MHFSFGEDVFLTRRNEDTKKIIYEKYFQP